MIVLVAIGVCFVCILGVGYLIARMGASEKSRIFAAKKHGECSGRENEDREWFI